MLAKDSLLHSLVNEFQVYVSDDVWEYRRRHIVALGKEAYDLALYDTHKFIHVLKTGVYGDPKEIRHEFSGVIYNAFYEKTGLEIDYLYAYASDGLNLEIEKIFNDLDKEYINRTVFEVNEYIVLKLEGGYTNIYVNSELFNQCKYILIRKPIDELEDILTLESVDELAEHLDHSLEENPELIDISPETRFWVHCSNMQVWYENNYDTRLLHSNLAFPLLKKLTEAGDPLARKVFKKEILKRIENGSKKTIEYLIAEGYYKFLGNDYYHFILDDDADVLLALEAELGIKLYYSAESCFEKSFVVENRNVVQLDLTFCELTSIPSIIRKLSNLKAIYLYGNLLRELPNWIGSMKNLEWIDIHSNNIDFLPDSIGNLEKLYYFDIRFNKIGKLPESMSRLNNLKTLKLKGNLINSIPKSLNNLKHLIIN
ncbi:MAG: hypothetical protein EU529_17170 [Promethearchaeota archaeon]|nr:MAG: hypothetical protein EU529_17170 [Candidatus Lokiarchaeota archaeon]